jgi:hypothetical protein
MQMVKRIVGGFFLSLILLWLFAPKHELYYFLEKKLKEKNIIISNETITDTWYGLKLTDADIYANGIKMANVSELNFNFFFFYNTLKVQEIKTDKAFHFMAPKEIHNLSAKYSILNPLNLTLKGDGSFGTLDGAVNLKNRKIEVLFPVAKELKSVKKFLKNDKTKGWYYETNY